MVARHRESQPAVEVGARRCESCPTSSHSEHNRNPPLHHPLRPAGARAPRPEQTRYTQQDGTCTAFQLQIGRRSSQTKVDRLIESWRLLAYRPMMNSCVGTLRRCASLRLLKLSSLPPSWTTARCQPWLRQPSGLAHALRLSSSTSTHSPLQSEETTAPSAAEPLHESPGGIERASMDFLGFNASMPLSMFDKQLGRFIVEHWEKGVCMQTSSTSMAASHAR